jgi:hypothetical protein
LVPGATTYIWSIPQGSQITSGQNTNRIVVKWGNRAGAVSVIAKNSCGVSTAQLLNVALGACAINMDQPIAIIRPVPEVVSNNGGFAIAGNISVEWTLGEPRVESVLNAGLLFTQGFHQPLVMHRKDSIRVILGNDLMVKVYPNPVSTILKVRFEASAVQKVWLQISDIHGRLMQQKTAYTNNDIEEMNMQHYTSGTYLLTIRDVSGKLLNTLKIIKTQ